MKLTGSKSVLLPSHFWVSWPVFFCGQVCSCYCDGGMVLCPGFSLCISSVQVWTVSAFRCMYGIYVTHQEEYVASGEEEVRIRVTLTVSRSLPLVLVTKYWPEVKKVTWKFRSCYKYTYLHNVSNKHWLHYKMHKGLLLLQVLCRSWLVLSTVHRPWSYPTTDPIHACAQQVVVNDEFVLLPILKIFTDFPSLTTRYSQCLMFSVCVQQQNCLKLPPMAA
jgi:hypothetical protein